MLALLIVCCLAVGVSAQRQSDDLSVCNYEFDRRYSSWFSMLEYYTRRDREVAACVQARVDSREVRASLFFYNQARSDCKPKAERLRLIQEAEAREAENQRKLQEENRKTEQVQTQVAAWKAQGLAQRGSCIYAKSREEIRKCCTAKWAYPHEQTKQVKREILREIFLPTRERERGGEREREK